MLSANGDAVWVFSLKGQLDPLWPPPAAADASPDPPGRLRTGSNTIKIGDNNVEYSLLAGAHPGQGGDRGDLHQCRRMPSTPRPRFEKGNWDTGALEKGESKTITF